MGSILEMALVSAAKRNHGRSPSTPNAGVKPPFWAVFGLGGPTACWRITSPKGISRVVAVWPDAVEADLQLLYPGCDFEQLFTEDERRQLIAAALILTQEV
jgi:hypothetical protein